MIDGRPEFPGTLGFEAGVSAIDPAGGKIAKADEIVEIELSDRPPDRELGVPATTRLPVDRQIGFEEFERPVRNGVPGDRELRIFEAHAAIDAQRRAQRAPDVQIDLAALLLDLGVRDRKVDLSLAPVGLDHLQTGRIVERIEGRFAADLGREFAEVLPSPRDSPDGLVALRLLSLFEPAVLDRAVVDQAVALDVAVEIIALAAGCEAHQLDRAASERTGDIPAELENAIVVILDEVVIVLRCAGW